MIRSSIARLADDAPVPHPESWVVREPPSFHIKSHHFVEAGEMVRFIDEPPTLSAAHAALEAEAIETVRAVIRMRARIRDLRKTEGGEA